MQRKILQKGHFHGYFTYKSSVGRVTIISNEFLPLRAHLFHSQGEASTSTSAVYQQMRVVSRKGLVHS